MKNIYECLEFINRDLIKKAKSIEKIFTNYIKFDYKHLNRKMWNSIILYHEFIYLNKIHNINCSFQKILLWMFLSNEEKNKCKWSDAWKVINSAIAFMEAKQVMKDSFNVINNDVLVVLNDLLINKNEGYFNKKIQKLTNELNNIIFFENKNKELILEFEEILKFLNDEEVVKNYGSLITITIAYFKLLEIKMFDKKVNSIASIILFNLFIVHNDNNLNYFKFSISKYFYDNLEKYQYFYNLDDFNFENMNSFLNFILEGFSESCVRSDEILNKTDQLINENIKKMESIFNKYILLHSDFKRMTDLFTFDHFVFMDVLDIERRESKNIVNTLIEKNILISFNENKTLMYKNLFDYLLILDKKMIKKN